MASVTIKRKIRSSLLRIKELELFRGKEVEITIKSQSQNSVDLSKVSFNVGGFLEKYKNTSLLEDEKNAWGLAVKDNYENN